MFNTQITRDISELHVIYKTSRPSIKFDFIRNIAKSNNQLWLFVKVRKNISARMMQSPHKQLAAVTTLYSGAWGLLQNNTYELYWQKSKFFNLLLDTVVKLCIINLITVDNKNKFPRYYR